MGTTIAEHAALDPSFQQHQAVLSPDHLFSGGGRRSNDSYYIWDAQQLIGSARNKMRAIDGDNYDSRARGL